MNWKNRIIRQETVPISDIVPNAKNWRKHPAKQQTHVKGSLDNLGWIRSVLVNLRTSKEWEIPHRNKKTVIDGHLRLDLALKNGEDKIPVEYVDLSPDEERIALASIDPLAAMAETDEKMLDALLASIDCAVPEITDMLGDIGTLEGIERDDPEPLDTEPQISRAEELRKEWGTELGQLWQCGDHRVLCGDCTDPAVVKRVMQGEKAGCVVTDPPYGMDLDTDFSGMKSKMFKGKTGGNYHDKIIGDAIGFNPAPILPLADEMFLFGADYYSEHLPKGGSWLVWDKRLDDSADKMFGSCFELCWSKKPHKREILRFKWAGIFGTESQDVKTRIHPAQKPIQLIADILTRYCKDIPVVLDPFLGSGTTMIACENLGRRCRGMEISPEYVAVSLQRYKDTFKKEPVLLGGD